MAALDRASTLPSAIKAVAAVYLAVLATSLFYALSSQHQAAWTEILVVEVVVCVALGAWVSCTLSPDRLSLGMPLTIAAFIALAVVLALIAPQEKTLGGYIRLIYIHAAVTWIGLALFAISFFAGAGHLINNKLIGANWVDGFFGNALYFWTASSVIGSVAAYLTWGPAWYMEPRSSMALEILVIAAVVFLLGPLFKKDALRVAVETAVPAVVFLMLGLTGKLVHPNNAFVTSDSFEIKLFALIITVVFAGVAVQGIRWLALSRGARRAA